MTKEEVAMRLARSHADVEPDISLIVRVVGPDEDGGREPIKRKSSPEPVLT